MPVNFVNFTAMGYAKLFSSITESSLWSEPKEVRLLFVTMLARADSVGFVEASVPGLARVANLTTEETLTALAALEGPDPHSKDLAQFPEHEGRRITRVPGGWVLLNYENYRDRPDEKARRDYMRDYMRDYRNKRKPRVNSGKQRLTQAETEAEAYAEIEKQKHVPPAAVQGEAEKKSRPRNLLLDALVALDGSDPVAATKPAFSRAAKALSIIKEVSPQVTPEEIARRARNYGMSHPTWELTCTALASHWSACDQKLINGRPAPPSIAMQNVNAAVKSTMNLRRHLEEFEQEECNRDKEPIR